jgi:hypothetical protein
MFEVLATWSRRRLFWTLVVASFLFLDAVSIWITSSAPAYPCIMEAVPNGSYYTQNHQCASFHLFLFENAAIYFERIWRLDGAAIFGASIGAVAVWQFVAYLTEEWTPLGWFYALDPINKFTLLLVIVGFTTALIFQGQLTIMNYQSDAMQNQLKVMEADQRPWIKTELSFGGDLTYSDNRMDVTFHYVLKNVGRSPALSVSGYPRLRPTYLSPFWMPSTGGSWIDLVNPVREIRDFCEDIASKVAKITEMAPWGDIIYPGDTIERDESVSLDVSDIKPELPPVNSLNWFNEKPQPTAPVLVLSCIDYQAGVGGRFHQTADYFVLSRKSPPGTFNDVRPLDKKTIIKDDLTLRPSVIYGTKYAN